MAPISDQRQVERSVLLPARANAAHTAECREHIAQQRKVVETAIQKGHSMVAESMLHALEVRLRAFEVHRQSILDRLKSASDDHLRQTTAS
jgi:hypothetical protein